MNVTVRLRSLLWFVTGAALMLVGTLIVTSAWRADAAPGPGETTFVPIPPCRLFDYRPGAGVSTRSTPIGPAETVTQQVTGVVGACNIPADATGIAMNVTATDPTAVSNLRIFPADVVDVPNASNLNYRPGDGATPNKVDLKLSPTGAIKIYNDFGSVFVLADATGYYTRSGLADLQQQINALKSAQAFALEATAADVTYNTTIPTLIVSISVTARVAGHVTVMSNVSISTSGPAANYCGIGPGTVLPPNLEQESTMSGTGGGAMHLNGTRRFPIAAGATSTYSLFCQSLNGFNQFRAQDSMLNAIFTPAL